MWKKVFDFYEKQTLKWEGTFSSQNSRADTKINERRRSPFDENGKGPFY